MSTTFATCRDCDWSAEYDEGPCLAYLHSRDNSHLVSIIFGFKWGTQAEARDRRSEGEAR